MEKLSIENKIENLAKVASFIEQFGEKNDLEMKTVFELNLILDELVTNIISYGYDDDDTHLIEVCAEFENDIVQLSLVDDAKKFNPLEKEDVNTKTPLEEKKIGGLGIHFVKQKADDISYKRENNKNILYITKKLKGDGENNGN